MLDRAATGLISPAIQRLARLLVRAGFSANQLTLAGFGIGLGAALLVATQHYPAAIAAILCSRLCDGLDGAMARETRVTDAGGFLDIALDFMFYAAIPLGFAFADPSRNALAAACLLAAFVGTMASFLAFAVLAERRGLSSLDYPQKGLYYLGGLTEAGETLACFAAMCLWPAAFAPLALGFAALCGLTLLARLHAGWHLLGDAA